MPRRKSQLFPTPDDAETAFYEAFERADLAAMMAVWAEDDDVVCVHPQGPRLLGFDAIRESWTQVFAAGMRLQVRTTEARQLHGQTLAVHSVVEVLSAQGEPGAPTVAATNVYALTEGGWRMMVHHASPLPAPPQAEPAPSESHTLH